MSEATILLVGDCKVMTEELRKKLQSELPVSIKEKTIQNNIEELLCPPDNTMAILICCQNGDTKTENFISYFHENFKLIPILGIITEDFSREEIHNLYKLGIVDHVPLPKDELDFEIICSKLNIFYSVNNYKLKTEIAIKKLEINLDKYIELLDVTKTAYVLMNPDGIIEEVNTAFLNILDCYNMKDIVGRKPTEWIITNDHKKFNESIKDVESGNLVEGMEIRLLKKDMTSVWISITGNLIESQFRNIIWIVKDITIKKETEHKSFIEKQKKRDAVRQKIITLREEIKFL